MATELWTAEVRHPRGRVALAATPGGLVCLAFGRDARAALEARLAPTGTLRRDPDGIAPAVDWVRAAVADGPSDPPPDHDLRLVRTPFARTVLAVIAAIPRGRTMSYAAVAAAAGRPRAVRAAAHVCATNPLPLVIACHRVIRTDGTRGDYGGGADFKAYLLDREAVTGPPARQYATLAGWPSTR